MTAGRGRMSEMRTLGIVFLEIGQVTYGDSKAFKQYAVETTQLVQLELPATKQPPLAIKHMTRRAICVLRRINWA
jgi:hypothetical protein